MRRLTLFAALLGTLGILSLASGCAKSGTSTPRDAGPRDDVANGDAFTTDPGRRDAMPMDGMPVPDGGCPGNLSECNGQCFDLRTSHEHCGSCDNACAVNETCVNGDCELECLLGWVVCHDVCVDPLTDTSNCGDCDISCQAGLHATPVCRQGICDVDCEQGWSDMDNDGSCETHCVPANPPTESCNGQDDDCDGRTDEDFACVLGETVSCITSCGSNGTGVCSSGCRLPTVSQCTPPPEQCNGRDDDCDGVCDDGFACCAGEESSCQTTCGSTGTKVCSASCQWGQCRPPNEVCNGQDDDCDGRTDEDFLTYQCPLTQATNPNRAACNSDCRQTADCVLQQISVSGDVLLRTCGMDECYPDYLISLIRGNGHGLEIYRAGNWGTDTLVSSITLSGATATGSVRLRSCSGDTCSPDYRISFIEGSNSSIRFYQDTGWGSDLLVGTITLSGATASGSVRYRSCTGDECNPDYLVSRITGNGTSIQFYRSNDINGHAQMGSITLSPSDYVCPLDSDLSCTGLTPSCTQTANCEQVVSCN